MGASGWVYYVPYQEDLEQAFHALRQQVFEAGDYHRLWLYLEVPEEAFDALDEISWTGTDQQLVEELAHVLERKHLSADLPPAPQTIDEVLQRNGLDGTHSILDIPHFSLHYEGIPIAEDILKQVCEDQRPTREMVEAIVLPTTCAMCTTSRHRHRG